MERQLAAVEDARRDLEELTPLKRRRGLDWDALEEGPVEKEAAVDAPVMEDQPGAPEPAEEEPAKPPKTKKATATRKRRKAAPKSKKSKTKKQAPAAVVEQEKEEAPEPEPAPEEKAGEDDARQLISNVLAASVEPEEAETDPRALIGLVVEAEGQVMDLDDIFS